MMLRIRRIDREEWQRLAPTFLDYNYRHLWDFGVACAMRLGGMSEHIALRQGNDVIGMADIRIKKIPIFKTGIAYINGGPIVRRDNNTDAKRLKFCLQALIDEYIEKRGLVLRIRTPLGSPDWNHTQTSVFSEMGFALSTRVPRYRTLLLNINRPIEDIRKNLEQKWRNCLNNAEKKSYGIRSSTAPELFTEFCTLFEQLIQRKQFDVDLDARFYAQVQNQLADGERFHISLADVEGNMAAGHVSSMLGDSCVYLLGASNQEGLRSKASYLLQWHIIQIARKQGCRWYDVGGIDPEGNPGVYHFKQGLGGIDITAPGPFEISPSRLKAHLVAGGEYLYRTVRRVFHPR
jgi:lipid II:glycine glycyltransferase (peptidoglycan interpeptide bridge formation enzyme)